MGLPFTAQGLPAFDPSAAKRAEPRFHLGPTTTPGHLRFFYALPKLCEHETRTVPQCALGVPRCIELLQQIDLKLVDDVHELVHCFFAAP